MKDTYQNLYMKAVMKLGGFTDQQLESFVNNEYEAEKLKIASEAWDAGYLKGKDHFDINYIGEPLPSKEAYLSTIKK